MNVCTTIDDTIDKINRVLYYVMEIISVYAMFRNAPVCLFRSTCRFIETVKGMCLHCYCTYGITTFLERRVNLKTFLRLSGKKVFNWLQRKTYDKMCIQFSSIKLLKLRVLCILTTKILRVFLVFFFF